MTPAQQKLRNYYLKNRASILERNKRWSQKNRQHRIEYFRSYDDTKRVRHPHKPATEEQKEKRRQYCIKHKEKLSAYWKQHRKDHPDKTKAHNKASWHRRRALIAKASINLKGIEDYIRNIKTARWFVCYYREQRFTTDIVHFDHIVPLSKGGEHSVANLRTACAACNLNKQDELMATWKKSGRQILPL